MKVVAVTSRFPYPIERGDKLRAFHQLGNLAEHHEVVLVALCEGGVDPAHRRRVEERGIRTHVVTRSRLATVASTARETVRGVPLQVGYFMAPSTMAEVRRIVEAEQAQHLYCQLLRTAWAAEGVGIPATIDYQDAFAAAMRRRASQHRGPLRGLMSFEADRIGAAEAAAFDAFDRRVVITEQDRALLEVPDPSGVDVLANGVDTSFFSRGAAAVAHGSDGGARFDVAFVGNMGYPPNVRAAQLLVERIMPLVWRRRPSARVLLAGARPARAVRSLGSARVEVSGWMDDIRSAYLGARVMVAPLVTGAGQQNKVLESMAMEVPVVTTELVNDGIGATHRRDLLVAADPEGFAGAIVDLLDSEDVRARMASSARGFVTANYSWAAVGRQLAATLERA